MYEVVRRTTRQTCSSNSVERRKHEDMELRVIRKTVCRRKHEIPCVGRKTPKTRKHGNSFDTESRVSWRKHGNPCKSTKTRKPVWRLKNAEIPNSRNTTTCSKTLGTQPELRASESLDIRKDGEDQRPMQNRILEQMSSARRRRSAPTRRVRNDDNDADEAWSRKGSKPKARIASS
jgi:hypothetical protein